MIFLAAKQMKEKLQQRIAIIEIGNPENNNFKPVVSMDVSPSVSPIKPVATMDVSPSSPIFLL